MAYFIYTRKAEVVISDNSYIEAQKAKLKRENDSLAKNIIKLVFQASAYEQKIDSLETVKQKIKPHYDKVYKKIDRYSSSQLIHELDSAFASDTR
jgi:ribosomal protein S20